jgi:hypothetical protein
MKHLLNDLSEEEKNNIREQHAGGMKVSNARFKTLLETKSGDVKPLVEQFEEDDYDFGFESPSCPSCKGNGCEECDGSGMKRNSVVNNDENEPYIDLTDDEDDDIHQIHRKMSSDDEELDEDTSWMNDLNEGDDDYAPTLKEKIEKAIRNSVTNKDEIIDVLEAILREKKGHGHVTKEKVLKNWMK